MSTGTWAGDLATMMQDARDNGLTSEEAQSLVLAYSILKRGEMVKQGLEDLNAAIYQHNARA